MGTVYKSVGNKIMELKIAPFLNEDVLHTLIENYVEIIPSEEIIGSPIFLVIKRELGTASGSIDLLMIDQNMIPTVVETKVNNSEVRRKIVAQGIDYVASLYSDLTGEIIEDLAKEYYKNGFRDAIRKLGIQKIDRKKLEKNIEKTRFRIIFAADYIPVQLRKMIEFLNSACQELQVYGVEIKQFENDDSSNIISVNVFGPSSKEAVQKSARANLIDEVGFFAEAEKNNKETFERLTTFYEVVKNDPFNYYWGTKSLNVNIKIKNDSFKLFEIIPKGSFFICLMEEEKRSEEINTFYRFIDEVFDTKGAFKDPKNKYKQAKSTIGDISEEKFEEFISKLKGLV